MHGVNESADDYLKRVCDYDVANDKLLYISDILEILKKANVVISRQTFYGWISKRSFPEANITIGKRQAWTERRFKQWLASCVVAASAPLRKGKKT